MKKDKVIGYSILSLLFAGLFAMTVWLSGSFWKSLLVYGSAVVVAGLIIYAASLIAKDE